MKIAKIKTLGPVGLNPLEKYNSETEYEKLDVVLYQGSSCIVLQMKEKIESINIKY